MLVLGVDTETTGLSLGSSRIVEMTAVLYDTETKIPVKIDSALIFHIDYIPIDPAAEKIHGLSRSFLQAHSEQPIIVFRRLISLAERADAFCAHNGNNFDKPMIGADMLRQFLYLPEKIWIDTSTDIEYPAHMKSRSLRYLAADHGIYFPKERRHRSIHDVFTMLEILSHYDVNEVLERAKSPVVELRAVINYEQRDLAKQRRFHWDAVSKRWFKLVKEFDIEKEIKECGFPVERA